MLSTVKPFGVELRSILDDWKRSLLLEIILAGIVVGTTLVDVIRVVSTVFVDLEADPLSAVGDTVALSPRHCTSAESCTDSTCVWTQCIPADRKRRRYGGPSTDQEDLWVRFPVAAGSSHTKDV